MGPFITLLIRQEYDNFGILKDQKIVDWKIDCTVLTVDLFPAQILSHSYEYKTIGTSLNHLDDLYKYCRNRNLIWDVALPQQIG